MSRRTRAAVAILFLNCLTLPGFVATAPDEPKRTDSKDLRRTAITPHLEAVVEPGRNLIYCATAQLAWNELRTMVGGHLKDEPPSVVALDKQMVTKDDLAQDSYFTAVGYIEKGIVERINAGQKAKFGGIAPALDLPERAGLLTYALLYKNLRFEQPFESADAGIVFATDGTSTKVQAFGIQRFLSHHPEHQKMAKQVEVLDYKADADFIVRLQSDSPRDEIVLAKIKPEKTLLATVETLEKRMSAAPADSLKENDTLLIPKLDFDITHAFPEIAAYLSALATGPARAIQDIRFRLNEKGALLMSRAMYTLSGRSDHRPRQLVFDRPFLICLKQSGSRYPYLAIWVADPELLLPVAPAATSGAAGLDGSKLVQTRCAVCHNTTRIEKAKHDRAGWEKIVNRMAKRGAKLEAAERQAVIDYLAGR